MASNHEQPQHRGQMAISEGTDVYGSDGTQVGRIEAVGARYLTIAAGLLGQKSLHLPLDLVARADTEQVEFAMPAVDAEARAYKGVPPPEEPIYADGEPIPPDERGAAGIPLQRRDAFGL